MFAEKVQEGHLREWKFCGTSGCGPPLERRSRKRRCGQTTGGRFVAHQRREAELPGPERASLAHVPQGVKKASRVSVPTPVEPEKSPLPLKKVVSRQKAPRVGERPPSSRSRGAARPCRSVCRANVRCAGGSSCFPRRSGQGNARFTRHEVPEAMRVGAKSRVRAIPLGSAEVRCSRPLSRRSYGG